MKLSPRETECLQYKAFGKSAKMIAQILGISHFTVEWHLRNILKRIGAVSIGNAIYIATKEGLIQ